MTRRFATLRINTYFAMLALTLVASAAALIIVRMGTATFTTFGQTRDEAQYQALRDSILRSPSADGTKASPR